MIIKSIKDVVLNKEERKEVAKNIKSVRKTKLNYFKSP